MTEIKLRPYQQECIDAVFDAWAGGMRRPAVVLPTGAGKTVVFSHLIQDFRMRAPYKDRSMGEVRGAPGNRVIVLVHRDELADQAIVKIRATMPGVTVGKVKASVNEITSDVMVCSVQTLASATRRDHILYSEISHGKIGLIITDECHHAAAPSYGKIYGEFPDALQLGVTATLARGDGQGLGDVWDDVVYERSIISMIAGGYLSDVKTRRVLVDGLDLSGVKTSRGDYQVGELGQMMEDQHADAFIAKAYLEHAADRPGVVFTPTVATAHAAAAELNKAGVRTAVIDGQTPREDRQQIFHDYRTGAVQVLANCMVLTEGFDAPWASCAVIARPTTSAGLYTQMVGRVLRPYPGKTDALVLDVVGASRHKLRSLIDLAPGFPVQDDEGVLLSDLVEQAQEAMEEKARKADQPAPVGHLDFSMKHKDVDMFAASEVAWNRSPGGVLFIGTSRGPVFLWPAQTDGLWSVVTFFKDDGKWVTHPVYRELDLGSAMMWGEAVAEDSGGGSGTFSGFGVGKSAPWRRKPVSVKAASMARAYGIDPTGMTAGEVSDAIDRRKTGSYFDRYVGSGVRAQ